MEKCFSIYYLREGYSLSDVSTWKKDFKTAVEKLKGNVIQFNNNYITKKNSFIGGNYKVALCSIFPKIKIDCEITFFFNIKRFSNTWLTII